jgi:transposase InsO family protein
MKSGTDSDCALDLVLDWHAVHRSPEIREHAARHGIRLWFIPAGHTDDLQPLDRAVFGALKAEFRRRFELECRQHPHHRVTKSGAIEILRQIWDDLEDPAISRGWQIYVDDFGPDQHLDDVDWEE